MSQSFAVEEQGAYDDEFANRKGRRRANRQIKQFVGEVDNDWLDELEEAESWDEPVTFERLRSRRKSRYDD